MEKSIVYFEEIVYLRAIAVLAVISIHVSAIFTSMDQNNLLTFLYMSLNVLSHFAVPLFVCISGFVLYNKYQSSFSIVKFYKKRFKSVVPQYTFFTIIVLLIRYAVYKMKGEIWDIDPLNILYLYLTGGAAIAFWFFVLIIQLYLLYPIVLRLFQKFSINNKISLLLGILFIIQIPFYIFDVGDIFLVGKILLFMGYMFYFVLGMYARSIYHNQKRDDILRKSLYTLFIGLLLGTTLGVISYFVEYFDAGFSPQLDYTIHSLFSALITPFYNILLFYLCLYLAFNLTLFTPNMYIKTMYTIGKYSFSIYLVHILVFLTFAPIALRIIKIDAYNWLYYPVSFALVLGISMVSIYIIKKLPYSEYIIGSTK